MKAPKCWTCSTDKEVRHWSTQPHASNKEHLTASNGGDHASNRATSVVPPVSAVVDGGASSRVRDLQGEDVPVVQVPKKQRWSRDKYNAYMKAYMARRRHE